MNSVLTLHLPGGVPMHFERIPHEGDPQPFRMGERGLGGAYLGSSDPVTWVRLTQRFYLGRFPVTQEQFGVWTRAEAIQHQNRFDGRRDHPAVYMSWLQAVEFCQWLNRSGVVPQGWVALLPTEAEWEYACRAGTETEYHTGDGAAALAEAGWYHGNAGGSTHPVGQRKGNAFGLFDMHGNVWEWCHDVYREHALCFLVDGVVDPGAQARITDYVSGGAPDGQESRVLRGGSYLYDAWLCRSAFRDRFKPVDQFGDWDVGFRVCLVPGPWEQTGRGAPEGGQAKAAPAPGDGGQGTRPESDGAGVASAVGAPGWTTARLPRAAAEFSSPGSPVASDQKATPARLHVASKLNAIP